jgi:hypothetical protein
VRRCLVGPDLCGDLLRLGLRELEEPGQHLLPVLEGEDLRELDDGGEAEPPVLERLDDLGERLDELGGGLPVVGSSLRKAELAVQEVEEGGMTEVDPEPPPVKVGQGTQKIGEREALAPEEVLQAKREVVCSVHE